MKSYVLVVMNKVSQSVKLKLTIMIRTVGFIHMQISNFISILEK